jgi:hypothetical protein
VIPTTDLVPLNNVIAAIANQNASVTGTSLLEMPQIALQSQFGLTNFLEAGFDYAETPDVSDDQIVFNIKYLLHVEDDWTPNLAIGMWNVTAGQIPGYYVTASKTLNYDQEQYERFRAHHRRNRKLLGRRVHLGMMVSGHGILEPFAGTDIQLSDSAVFQADWVAGAGNNFSAGLAYVMPDQRTVINPALLIANDGSRFNGIAINISHQFNM